MKKLGFALLVPVVIVVVIVLASAAWVLPEWEQAIVTQFGRPVGQPIVEPGVHFKMPFVQQVNRFDKRILEWDGEGKEIPTADKRFIRVDTTARWKIADPLLFLMSVRDQRGAQSRLDDIIDAAARDEISKRKLVEMVRITNRILDHAPEVTDQGGQSGQTIERITTGRDEIARKILENARPTVLESFGIELVDVRIKRVNYVKSVREDVYKRMRSERERIAEEYRSEGQGLKARITGQLEREQKTIESEAYRDAQRIVAEADAKAARVFAEAYNADPEFYAFYRSLETYEKVVGENTMLVISPDSDLYHYLFSTRER